MPNETEEEKKMKECADRAAKDGYKLYSKDADEEEKEKKEKEAVDKMAADKAAKDKAAKDAEEKEKEGDTEAKDKAAKDKMAKDKAAKDADEKKADEDKEKKEGMDAAMDSMRSELAALKKDGVRALLKEVNARDTLYAKVSEFVGAFDCSVMTTDEVAEYGVQKLGLKCPKGSETIALDSFFHARKSPTDQIGYALDTGSNEGKLTLAELFSKPAQAA